MTSIRTLRRRAEAQSLRRTYALMVFEEETVAQENTLGRLNDALFEELQALREVDPTDKDALAAEVERSKAIEGVAKTVIENANTVLTATRMRAQLSGGTVVPRMLEG